MVTPYNPYYPYGFSTFPKSLLSNFQNWMRSPKIAREKEAYEIFYKNGEVGKTGGFSKRHKIPDFFAVLSTILTELYFNH